MDVARAVIGKGPVKSDVRRARSAGPLRLLTPRAAGDAAWIVVSSFGGGLVDGDNTALEVEIEDGATCVITTQASTKAYKGRSSQRLDVRVHGSGCAIVVPDPIVAYRDASYRQITRIALAAESSLVLCDIATAGRLAYGERWSFARFDAALSIEIAGTRVLHDRLVLDAATASRRMRRFAAIGTAIAIGPRVGELGRARLAALPETPPPAQAMTTVIAGSPLADGAMLRVAGADIEGVVAATRAQLADACARLGEHPWSRRW